MGASVKHSSTVVPALFLCVFLECVFAISVRFVALLCIAVLYHTAKNYVVVA